MVLTPCQKDSFNFNWESLCFLIKFVFFETLIVFCCNICGSLTLTNDLGM